ncbi:hypothetical protein lwe1032 [Listeria welshimeri serovar 6b str. SLCC5334]|uniref:Uncharacterized protein n=1 Tax=Listeria welshimeri serovar 6b (strain ATCC 35897 / DSM 20650 / CCUG 15529 / CIP 8149 / NCTC 11857 / SLCC 5334 / V8) TaxID=386043 RepID=A0AHG8_LISW6|nr:hypothetical protein lwe1032 [Listeria welshimeri serovar 6b str. SLCC5334]
MLRSLVTLYSFFSKTDTLNISKNELKIIFVKTTTYFYIEKRKYP